MPGTPTIVTSCGDDAARTRRDAPIERVDLARGGRPAATVSRCGDGSSERGSSATQQGTGSRLPLASIGVVRLEHDLPLGRAERRLADEHAVDRRGRLQPRGGVDDVARDHALTRERLRAERDERLAGVDADADVQVLAALGDRVAHGERGAHGALGVVLVRRRRAEHRHHGVADELLDRAAEALEHRAQRLVVRRERAAHVLHVERSLRLVKPTRSANSTVTTLRSSRRSTTASAAPQCMQKRAAAGTSPPHDGHEDISAMVRAIHCCAAGRTVRLTPTCPQPRTPRRSLGYSSGTGATGLEPATFGFGDRRSTS